MPDPNMNQPAEPTPPETARTPEQAPAAGQTCIITKNPDGTYTVNVNGQDQPAASIDEALNVVRETLEPLDEGINTFGAPRKIGGQ